MEAAHEGVEVHDFVVPAGVYFSPCAGRSEVFVEGTTCTYVAPKPSPTPTPTPTGTPRLRPTGTPATPGATPAATPAVTPVSTPTPEPSQQPSTPEPGG
jgi:hypothetical protein